ncbi:MAG: phosphatidylglycerophosphatase A [Calditrichia bacterium]
MKYIIYFVATVAGAGYSPVAPGTMGALVAIMLAFFLQIPLWGIIAGIIGLTIIGTWASYSIEKNSGEEDPGLIVIDEFVGQWISIILVPVQWKYYIVAFLLFRVFDIAKPWPIRQSQYVGKGVGVMLDDILAGIYALVVIHIAIWFGF